jgi:multisubunit Na+/H+ antiporter MnhE subunit
MIFQCTGGGILVPIFINAIPVPLAQDAYPIAIMVSFLLHNYLPIVREILELSPIFKSAVIVLYEAMRASVLVKLTAAAGKAIAPSDFSFAVFGPIMCGTVGGCGGAFLPLNKGLDPIKDSGLGQPMVSALIAASFYHLFVTTSLSDGVLKKEEKAHVLVAVFFIAYHLATAFPMVKSPPTVLKPDPTSKKSR